MSADCCCKNDGCSDGVVSACCLPTPDDKGTCEQLTECECLKRGGQWLNPDNYGVSPVPCERCYVCECCGTDSSDGIVEFRGQRYKRHLFDISFRCPPGTRRRGATSNTSDAGNCPGECNVPCTRLVTGLCCHCGGATLEVSKCDCDQLRRANSPNALGIFLPNETDEVTCDACICGLDGVLATVSATCNTTFNYFGFGGRCSSIQSYDPTFYAQLVTLCAGFGNGNGGRGGGGGGPPVTPPIPPRPPQPPAPPKPCTRPPVYNPTCSYKVWFTIVTEKYEDPCNNYTRESINLYRLPDFNANSCNTLSCCGAPAPDCTDAEALTIATEIKRVTNCTFGDTDTQIGSVTLTCNTEATIQAYINPCDPCPDSRFTKVKLICAKAQFLRGCCDTNMNFLQFQIPETGIKENGVWTLYYPAETVVIDLRNQVCVGYDRNHPSCKKP